MQQLGTSNLKLGIIAGGQLGKMLIQEASKWDIETFVLDPDEQCPARSVASHYIQGNNLSYDDVYRFGKLVDILTFEFESVNIDAVRTLKEEGLLIAPDPEILALIQDKGLQKQFYQDHDIPTAPFTLFSSELSIKRAIEEGSLTYPLVQKLRKGGYDGKGVAVIKDESSMPLMLEGASVVEQMVPIDKEISVIVARNARGEVRAYPVVEMTFDPKANLVDNLLCPASITSVQEDTAIHLAKKIITELDMVGLLAIEFFIDKNGTVIVNEMAPRTHNSGHHTIESIVTSQFEQQLRAILNLPLGSTEIKMPSVMVNVVGAEGHSGSVWYQGLEECLAIEGVKVHLYGKKMTKPYRKMGHITALGHTIEEALDKANQVKKIIKVISCTPHL